MSVPVLILVSIGLAFDVFYITVAQGSVLGRVSAKSMLFMCLIVCAWQAVSAVLGSLLGSLVHVEAMSAEAQNLWEIVAAVIFIGLGAVKLMRLYRKKEIPESLAEVDFRMMNENAAKVSAFTFFAAIACALGQESVIALIITVFLLAVALVISGIYVGLRNGQLNRRVYWAGGFAIMAAGILEFIGAYI